MVYTEIFKASMELLVLTDLYPIKFIIKIWLIVYVLYFWKILKYFNEDLSSWSSLGSVSFAALGPNAVQRPKPVNSSRTTRIVTAIETAGSGADDKVCINFAKFVNNLCISSYTIAK